MIPYIGDYKASSTVRYHWATNGSNGASITRATNGNIRVYKNTSTTQRTSSNGITDTEDFDSLTGLHVLAIDLSDNTDASFYAAGNDYFVVLEGAVIDGLTVNAPLFAFSIENRTPRADTVQWNGSNVATPDTAGYPKVTIKEGAGAGELQLTNGALDSVIEVGTALTIEVLPDGIITAASIASNALTSAKIADGALTLAKFGAGTIDTILSNLTTIEGYLDTEITTILTNLASVASTLSTVAGNVDTEVAAILAAVDTEVASILASVDTEIGSIQAAVTAIKVVTDKLANMITGSAPNEQFTENALENAPAGGGGGGSSPSLS